MALSCLLLGLFTLNLGILWKLVCTLWLCGSIVANPIIYRPRPPLYEIRQCTVQVIDNLCSYQMALICVVLWGISDNAVARVLAPHQCDLGLIPGVICRLSLLLDLTLVRGFSKFQFDQDIGPVWKPVKPDVAFSLNIIINIFKFIF